MNKEEAIDTLKELRNSTHASYYLKNSRKCDEAIDVLLKLIEKQEEIIYKIAENLK